MRPYKERGIASWYGRKFHNQKTSTGETYDMYAMTAAHPTLPLPSYARVTNVANGKSVVVRVNDRGPFHPGRIIDLSYAAAYRIGIAQKGSGEVEVESILPARRRPSSTVTPLPPVAAIDAAPPAPDPDRPGAGRIRGAAGRVRQQCERAELCRDISRTKPRRSAVEAKVRQVDGLFRVVRRTLSDTRRCPPRARATCVTALGLDGTVKAPSTTR